jgi:hypothetical protein
MSHKMTQKAVVRIQRATAKVHSGKTPKGSFAARAQRTIAKGKGK